MLHMPSVQLCFLLESLKKHWIDGKGKHPDPVALKDKNHWINPKGKDCDEALWPWLQGLLLVQQNKQAEALTVLEPLFEHIEPMQETVAIRLCLLLVELYLASHNFTQAASELLMLGHVNIQDHAYCFGQMHVSCMFCDSRSVQVICCQNNSNR